MNRREFVASALATGVGVVGASGSFAGEHGTKMPVPAGRFLAGGLPHGDLLRHPQGQLLFLHGPRGQERGRGEARGGRRDVLPSSRRRGDDGNGGGCRADNARFR